MMSEWPCVLGATANKVPQPQSYDEWCQQSPISGWLLFVAYAVFLSVCLCVYVGYCLKYKDVYRQLDTSSYIFLLKHCFCFVIPRDNEKP